MTDGQDIAEMFLFEILLAKWEHASIRMFVNAIQAGKVAFVSKLFVKIAKRVIESLLMFENDFMDTFIAIAQLLLTQSDVIMELYQESTFALEMQGGSEKSEIHQREHIHEIMVGEKI